MCLNYKEVDFGWTQIFIMERVFNRQLWEVVGSLFFKCLTEGIWSLIGDAVLALSNSWLQNGRRYFQGPFLFLNYKIVK